MKLSKFIALTNEEKKSTVLHQGVLIGKRSGIGYMVFLFQLENYYVETYCNPENKQVEEYRMFQNTWSLAPYLNAIPIDGLLS